MVRLKLEKNLFLWLNHGHGLDLSNNNGRTFKFFEFFYYC